MGFTRRPLLAAFPEMKPVVAFARTAIIRAREPHPRGREEAKEVRLGYYEHIAAEPLPSIAVIQDIDAPDTGFGAFWGEVQTHVHKGLGCAGVITDGSVRDLDAMAPDFLVLAGSIMPSHAHVHLVDYGGTVSVAGMTVSPNDVIHADRHGAVVIPPEAVKEIPAAVDLIARREKVHHRRLESPRLLGRPAAPGLRGARGHSLGGFRRAHRYAIRCANAGRRQPLVRPRGGGVFRARLGRRARRCG